MDDDRDVSIAARVIRAAQRGDPATSVTAFIDSLRAEDVHALLGGLTSSDGPVLLCALWPSAALHPHLVPAVAAAASQLHAVPADALLTEAEALLVKAAANYSISPTERLRRLTTTASELMRAPANLHTARMIIACARCCYQIPVPRGRTASDRMYSAIVRKLSSPECDHAAAAILALLLNPSKSMLSASDACLLRDNTVRLVQYSAESLEYAHGVGPLRVGGRKECVAREIPALLKAVLGRSAARRIFEEENIQWANVAIQIVRHAPSHLFPDLLSVLEWQLAEAPFAVHALLSCYGHVSELYTYELDTNLSRAPSIQSSSVVAGDVLKVGERDIALLFSVLRSVDMDAPRQMAFEVIVAVLRKPGRFLDMSMLAASSSSANMSLEFMLEKALHNASSLPGMELRCDTIVDVAYWLSLSPKDALLRHWGSNLMVHLFIRYELARLPVIDTIFSSLTEDICSPVTCAVLCDVLERIVACNGAAALLRNHVGRIKHWLGHLSTMPACVAVRLVGILAPLVALVPAFCDYFVLALRKLSGTRSTHARQIASGGLSALLVDKRLDRETAESIVGLASDMFETGSLRSRAILLWLLTPRLCQTNMEFLRGSRYDPLHSAILSRVAQLASVSSSDSGVRSDEICPFQLNACFEITCGEPCMRDSIPELLEYVLALRRVDMDVDILFHTTVAYIGDARRALRDAGHRHENRDLSAKWVYVKALLLTYMCELLLDHAQSSDASFIDISAVLKTYAGALVVRDGIPTSALRSGVESGSLVAMPPSAYLERPFCGSNQSRTMDQVSAREASSVVFMAGAGSVGKDGNQIDVQSVLGYLPSNLRKRSALVFMSLDCLTGIVRDVHSLLADESLAAAVIASELARAVLNAVEMERSTRTSHMHVRARSRIVPLAVHLFCLSHPWTKESSRENVDVCSKRVGQYQAAGLVVNGKSEGAAPCSLQVNGSETQAETSMVRGNSDTCVLSDSEAHQATTRSDVSRAVDDDDSNLRNNFFSAASEFTSDPYARTALERMQDIGVSWNRSRASLRYYALQILNVVSDLEVNAPVWDRFVASVFNRPMVETNISTTAAGNSANQVFQSGETVDDISKCGQIAYGVLACFELEFKYSMSTSLSICYVEFLDRILFGDSVSPVQDSWLSSFKVAVSTVIARILRSYKVSHPRVLRPMFALLLKSMETSTGFAFLSLVLPWLGSNEVQSPGDDIDLKNNSRRQEKLTLTADDLDRDILTDSDVDSSRESVASVKVVPDMPDDRHSSCADGQDTDGLDGTAKTADSRWTPFELSQVKLLSLTETLECRNSCLLASLTHLETVIPRRRILGSRTRTSNAPCSNHECWTEHDKTIAINVCSSLECILFGQSLSLDKIDSICVVKRLSSGVLSRIGAVISAILHWARDGAKFLVFAVRSSSVLYAAEGEYALTLAKAVLQRLHYWRGPLSRAKDPLLSEGRVRYLMEQMELEIAAAIAYEPRSDSLRKALHAMRIVVPQRSTASIERNLSMAMDGSEEKYMPRRKRRRPMRSRNTVVDEWLVEDDWSDDRDDDNYADMEDYIVGLDCDVAR
jgi:FANCI solenoid 2